MGLNRLNEGGVIFPNATFLEWISFVIALVGIYFICLNYMDAVRNRQTVRNRKHKHPIFEIIADEYVSKDLMRLQFMIAWAGVGAIAMYLPGAAVTTKHEVLTWVIRGVYIYVEGRTILEGYRDHRNKKLLDEYTEPIAMLHYMRQRARDMGLEMDEDKV